MIGHLGIHVVHGNQKRWATGPHKTLLELRVDKDIVVNKGAAGGSIGGLTNDGGCRGGGRKNRIIGES